jgi:hypothetical protein
VTALTSKDGRPRVEGHLKATRVQSTATCLGTQVTRVPTRVLQPQRMSASHPGLTVVVNHVLAIAICLQGEAQPRRALVNRLRCGGQGRQKRRIHAAKNAAKKLRVQLRVWRRGQHAGRRSGDRRTDTATAKRIAALLMMMQHPVGTPQPWQRLARSTTADPRPQATHSAHVVCAAGAAGPMSKTGAGQTRAAHARRCLRSVPRLAGPARQGAHRRAVSSARGCTRAAYHLEPTT